MKRFPLQSIRDAASVIFDKAGAAAAIVKRHEEVTAQMAATLAANEQLEAMIQENVAPYRRLMACYECAVMEVETKFKVLDTEFSLRHDRNPIDTICTRLKSVDSLAKKLVARNLPMTVEAIEDNIFDVAGVRVICAFPEDVFALADALLAQDDITLVERKDYITNPKPSGYRSLHLIVEVPIFLEHEKKFVKVEVQLRTISMNFWASLEHQLCYKKNLTSEELEAISTELVQVAEDAANLDWRMQDIRNRLERE